MFIWKREVLEKERALEFLIVRIIFEERGE